MKPYLFAGLILSCCVAQSARAERDFDLFIEPSISSGYGSTSYVLDETGYLDKSLTIIGHVKSELIFHLNTTYAGVRFGIKSRPSSKSEWSVEGSYRINVADPRDRMSDKDWESAPGIFEGLWSTTTSSSKQHSSQWSLEGSIAIIRSHWFSAGPVAGFQFQHVKQDIYGLEGWQLYNNFQDTGIFDIPGGNVAYYEVTWKTPYVGTYYEAKPSNAWNIRLMTAFAPTFVNDKDIHMLRVHDGIASGNGLGFVARLSTELNLGSNRAEYHPYVGLSADFKSLSVHGKQELYWYATETDGTDTIPAGTRIGNVPHQMVTSQWQISLRVGLMFGRNPAHSRGRESTGADDRKRTLF